MQGAMNAVMTHEVLRMAADEMKDISPGSLLEKLNHVLTSRLEGGCLTNVRPDATSDFKTSLFSPHLFRVIT